MASDGHQLPNGKIQAATSTGGLTIDDKVFTAQYVADLRRWVTTSKAQFTDEEYRRAMKAVAFAEQKNSGPSYFAPRVTLSSVIYLLVAVVLLALGDNHGLFPALLCFAALAVGWPRWIHVVALVVGFFAVISSPIGFTGLALVLIGWLLFMFAKGKHR